VVKLVVVVGVEYSFRNFKVVPMGKSAGVNQLKFLKTLGQTLEIIFDLPFCFPINNMISLT